MGFPRQEYWSGLPFFSPGDLADPGIKLMSPALISSLPLSHQGSSTCWNVSYQKAKQYQVLGKLWKKGHPWHKLVVFRCCSFVVQSLSCVQFFETPWTAAPQVHLSFIISWSLLKLMSTESVMLSNHLILCCPFSFCLQFLPASGSFPINQFFTLGGQSIGVSALASVLPINIQSWFPLRLTGLISL